MAAGGLDVGGIEYLQAADGQLLFHDTNANSNQAPIGEAFARRFASYLDGQARQIGCGHIFALICNIIGSQPMTDLSRLRRLPIGCRKRVPFACHPDVKGRQ
jgi:hypothetical protein